MFSDTYIRWLVLELCKQLDRVDDDVKIESLDKIVDIFSKRRQRLGYIEPKTDHYEVKPIGGYYVIYKNGMRQKGAYWSEQEAWESITA